MAITICEVTRFASLFKESTSSFLSFLRRVGFSQQSQVISFSQLVVLPHIKLSISEDILIIVIGEYIEKI